MARIAPAGGYGASPKPPAHRQKKHRVIDDPYRKWIKTLPCCVSGIEGQTDPAHIRIGRARMGRKSGDDLLVPLSRRMHTGGKDSEHERSDRRFWNENGQNPHWLALILWDIFHDYDGDRAAALLVIGEFRRMGQFFVARKFKFFQEKT